MNRSVIRSVAFCPHPPLLIPAVAGRAAAELDDLRAACRSAVRAAATAIDTLVLLGTGPTAGTYLAGARGTLRPYGVDVEVLLGDVDDAPSQPLPLSLTVGAWLVTDAAPGVPVRGFAVTDSDTDCDAHSNVALDVGAGNVGLIVLGDGSARRSRTAPGYLDERAAAFDAQVATALGRGDAEALAGLDPALGADLLAAGTSAWRAAGRLLAGRDYAARLHYDAAPYGVGYLVADWRRRD